MLSDPWVVPALERNPAHLAWYHVASIEEDSNEGFETGVIEGRQVTPPSHQPEECER